MVTLDLLFDQHNLDGYWLGLGLMKIDGSIGHEDESERGEYQSLSFVLNNGYTKKIIHNLSINVWGGFSYRIAGDRIVWIDDHFAFPKKVVYFVSVELGWHL
jgi:hypothetical protein